MESKQSLSRYSVLFTDMDQHYKTLVDTLPGIVYALDEKGHFAYLSSTITNVLGYSPDDLIGLHFSNIVHPDDIPAVSRDYILPKFTGIATGNERAPKLFDERRAPQRRTTGLRMRLLAKKSRNGFKKSISCNVNSSGQHLINDSHRFLGTVGILFDFSTEEVAASALEKRNTYNPFELFSQAMRHTFSNVFTGIYGNLQLMEMQINQNKDFRPNIEAIKASVENAVEVMKKLSNMASENPAIKKSLSTETLVKDAAEEIFESRQVGYTFDVKDNLLKLDVDHDYAYHIVRSVLFLIRENVGTAGEIHINLSNAEKIPPEIPRLDCKYIMISAMINKKNEAGAAVSVSSELDRVASISLGYLLLKKSGGLVMVVSENEIALYLPAL